MRIRSEVIVARVMMICALALTAHAALAAGAHEAFNGVWQITSEVTALKTADGKQPPLLPEAKATYEKNRQARKAGDLSYDITTQCQPHGVPRLLFETMPFEIMVQKQPKYVGLFYQWNRLVRVVEMDKAHYEPLGPTYLGQPVGKWDGDTLVVDTNGFGDTTVLDAEGMPHSDQLHVIERYTLSKNGQQLNAQINIEDPKTFSSPWQTQATFKRVKNGRIEEDVCVNRLGLEQYK